MTELDEIFNAIKADPQNAEYTARGVDPLYAVDPAAKIVLIGQAPGIRAEESKMYWNDPSGDRLRDWMGIDRETFYDPKQVAIVPLDFYYPGKGKSGDLPPRKGFAEKWHPQLLAAMPNLQLTVLIGMYAQKFYLGKERKRTLTDTVHAYKEYLPKYFPLVHPSPRNQLWMSRNPWFAADVLPDFKKRVHEIITER
ncbi:uracil-DNA glycosylase family protein [Lacticaseibacillus hulanensis]|uniref:uracil-DNA glycosylase family protein n=1 Tax=Lacticaseibacillus hulanensis TaxID=2493111 RepID=UPI000FD82C3C|nr:uracil-DNA glycosylase family protein [Lacticaseibacillus hulanensis]